MSSYLDNKRDSDFKKETKRRKKALLESDIDFWAAKAKKACHDYIKLRDFDKPCISCGTTANVQYAAGHYRPSGVNAALRYDESNIHKQCNRYCNSGMSGNLTLYRIGLIQRVGIETVEWLESNHDVKRWTIDDLKAVIEHYQSKTKALRAEIQP